MQKTQRIHIYCGNWLAYFIGMHALQVLPVLSFYLIKNTKGTVIVALLFGILALFTLVQALQGKPITSLLFFGDLTK